MTNEAFDKMVDDFSNQNHSRLTGYSLHVACCFWIASRTHLLAQLDSPEMVDLLEAIYAAEKYSSLVEQRSMARAAIAAIKERIGHDR